MFRRLLVANRGEIACRIFATAQAMGIRTVAVYSDADRDARHVRLADEAIRLGPAPVSESYLNAARLLEVCQELGVDAVHPGYGLLSENAEFAEAVSAAGMTFVGPPPAAIRDMGEKARAKKLMAQAGIPLTPGYDGDSQEDADLIQAAAEIGYPLLIKACAGGGGRGMRPAHSPEEFTVSLAAARREAKAAFGDDRVLLESLLPNPRHIEAQVFADRHGNCVHLFERDCSVQRRYQKIIEEAPALGLPADTRAALAETAVRAALAIGYEGAGTVEFLYCDGTFYFMEMNTRLQVEHPVTEAITGLDLVEWQLRVAAGEPLPLTQEQVRQQGHAIEVRVCCESPTRGFLPVAGTLGHVHFPEGLGLRVDSGVFAGCEVPSHYDSLIAKVIAHGETRDQALDLLGAALDETEIAGAETNVGLLRTILDDADFRAGEVDISYLSEERLAVLAQFPEVPDWMWAALALLLARDLWEQEQDAGGESDNPWRAQRGFRLNAPAQIDLRLSIEAESREIRLRPGAGEEDWELQVGDQELRLSGLREERPGRFAVTVSGRRRSFGCARLGTGRALFYRGWALSSALLLPDSGQFASAEAGSGRILAPLPGRLAAVHAAVGDRVKAGQKLLVVEAMKMEHILSAKADGKVVAALFAEGDSVAEGDELMRIEVSEREE